MAEVGHPGEADGFQVAAADLAQIGSAGGIIFHKDIGERRLLASAKNAGVAGIGPLCGA